MKKILIIILIISLLASCSKHSMTVYSAELINQSNVEIKIIPYKEGYPTSEFIIYLKHNELLDIGEGVQNGIIKGGGFLSDYLTMVDSAIVIFDSVYPVVYYQKDPDTLAKKYVSSNNPRNFLKYKNYDFTFRDESKKLRYNNFKYTFQISDFQYAKD